MSAIRRNTGPGLLAFPCDASLARGFLDRVPARGARAILLEKQAAGLIPELERHGITERFLLPEDLYGRVRSERTVKLLRRLREQPIGAGRFPFSDFNGNTALLLGCVTSRVSAMSATAIPGVEQTPEPVPARILGPRPDGDRLREVQREILRRMEAGHAVLRGAVVDGQPGERPVAGLLEGFPYDSEVLFRYALAARRLRGRILEVGCGLGFGAWALARLNPSLEIVALDSDEEAVAGARTLWGDCDNLDFEVGDGERLRFDDGRFDGVVAFEVIEHVEKPGRLLEEAARVSRADALLVGSTPDSRLYPYRVNTEGSRSRGLQARGIWPWHIQTFDEERVRALVRHAGFTDPGFGYPTWERGRGALEAIRQATFEAAIEILRSLSWEARDFALLDRRVPCFSGYSFVFFSRRA